MKKAAIIDLDGTLIDANSFTMYVKHILARHPQVAIWAALRKLRLLSHAAAKQHILRSKVSETEIDRIVNLLVARVRPEVASIAEKCDIRILATAAPAIYARPLGERLGFTHVLATETGGAENMGEEKCRRVTELLQALDAEASVIATDHEDDMPLLKAFPEAQRHLYGSLAQPH